MAAAALRPNALPSAFHRRGTFHKMAPLSDRSPTPSRWIIESGPPRGGRVNRFHGREFVNRHLKRGRVRTRYIKNRTEQYMNCYCFQYAENHRMNVPWIKSAIKRVVQHQSYDDIYTHTHPISISAWRFARLVQRFDWNVTLLEILIFRIIANSKANIDSGEIR